MNIQDEALAAVTRTWVELTFPGGQWNGAAYCVTDPTEPGATIAFRISDKGKWIRGIGGTGNQGTVVDLIAKRDKITLEQAAAKILGRELQGIKATRKVGKIKAVMPVPQTALKVLSELVRGEGAAATHGAPMRGYTYRRGDGGIAFCVTPYVTDSSEVVQVPYFWGEDSSWHEGYPADSGRPLYKLEMLNQAPRELPVIVVASERDANVEVPGHIVVSWSGGISDIKKTDWSPLDGRPVTIWAPAKVSATLKNRLTEAVVLDLKDHEDGWGLFDAKNTVDVLAFLETCPKIGGESVAKGRPDDAFPFLCLGYDKDCYYFLPRRTRVLHKIAMGTFRNAQMLELAPLSWWGDQGMVTDAGAIKQAPAQELLIEAQQRTGWFDQMRLRGTGVWRDAGGIVLNDGRKLLTMDGQSHSYDDYRTLFNYMPSKIGFGAMFGEKSSDEEGRRLQAIFEAQQFEESSMAVLLLGWCLVCCFGSVLNWRPHGWVTGGSGTGKGWLYEKLILPLAGPYAHIGSGQDTGAGTKWALDQDPRPAIMAEMEIRTETDKRKIEDQVNLARNASDDTSGFINQSQSGGGIKSFHLRSMFLFQSIRVPEGDRSISGRFVMFELKSGKVSMDRKISESKRLLDGGLMDDPGRFRRRIFHALPRIIADIEYIREHFRAAFGDQRAVDQVAPLLAAAWAVQSTKPVADSGVWIDNWVAELAVEGKRVEDDEDTFMRHLLGAVLRTDENKSRTVAELMLKAAGSLEEPNGDTDAEALLERYGMGLKRTSKASPLMLCIATNSAKLAELFAKTPYASGYGAQVRRHPLAEEEQAKIGGGTKGVHKILAGQRVRCQLLDWERFRAKYIDDAEVEEKGDGQSDIPF